MNRHRFGPFVLLVAVTLASVPSLAQQNQAEFHYKVALAALKDNNFDIASTELEKAAALAPGNPLIHLNLAIVKQKKGDPGNALESLKRAMALGIPKEHESAATELMATLSYERMRNEQGIIGRWARQANDITLGNIASSYTFDADGRFDVLESFTRTRVNCMFAGTYKVEGTELVLTLKDVANPDKSQLCGLMTPFASMALRVLDGDKSDIGRPKRVKFAVKGSGAQATAEIDGDSYVRSK